MRLSEIMIPKDNYFLYYFFYIIKKFQDVS